MVAIRKALQRLTARGLVQVVAEPHPEKKGTTVNRYFAVLSRDMCSSKCPTTPKPSVGQEIVVGQGVGVSHHSEEDLGPSASPAASRTVELPKVVGHKKGCPTTLPSADAGSECWDTNSVTPQGAERSQEEIQALQVQATQFWD
ncbi:MAG: hypothetical protein ACO4AV_11000 [bacterium]